MPPSFGFLGRCFRGLCERRGKRLPVVRVLVQGEAVVERLEEKVKEARP